LSKIISIGTANPPYRHEQREILKFMQNVFALNDSDARKIGFLYRQSGIETRYSVIADYSRNINDWKFYPKTENLEPFPSLEQRMTWFAKYAAPLSVDAIRRCINKKIRSEEITHLITVSCTGMSAPGLDLQIIELMQLQKNIFRTSINFMGCYAAIHALKLANSIAISEPEARILIVCTELCTLHFQYEPSMDNISSSLLFSDGSAAVLVVNDGDPAKGLRLESFHAEIQSKGKKDMAWELSSTGFLMTLSNYIPELIQEDFKAFTMNALSKASLAPSSISHWCIHPGGKRILDVVGNSLGVSDKLGLCYDVLRLFGNMSSATILFVLEKILSEIEHSKRNRVFAAGFGPGLTLESFIAEAC